MNKILAISILAFAVLGGAHAQSMYKWVDAEGNVTYQDQPPPGASESDAFALDQEVAAESENGAAAAAAGNPVTLYAVSVCDACDLVRNVLQKNGIPFTEKNADESTSVQDELIDLSGQLSVPLLAVGKNLVYGYNSRAIADELTRAGYPMNGGTPAQEQQGPSLSPEEIAEQAAAAADELISSEESAADDLLLELEDDQELIEEIPENERIKIDVSGE